MGSALHPNRPRRPSGQPRKWGRKGRGERGDELCWPTLSSCPPRTPATGNRFQAHDAGTPEGLYVEAPPTRARVQNSASLAETSDRGRAPSRAAATTGPGRKRGTGCPLDGGWQGPAQAQTPVPRPPESRKGQERPSKEGGGDSPG